MTFLELESFALSGSMAVAAGLVGCFAVMRRMTLAADAISHIALPGIGAALLGYAAWFHSWWGSYTLSRAEGFYLWGRGSSFAECSVVKPPASELAICPSDAISTDPRQESPPVP